MQIQIKGYTAGYFNAAIKKALIQKFEKQAEIMLKQLCRFELSFNGPAEPSPVPEIAVLCNMIQRGLPTWPPLVVENALCAIGLTNEQTKSGSIEFPLKGQLTDTVLEDLFTALHLVDNRFEPLAVDKKLESSFERLVFWTETKRYPHLRQVLIPQASAPLVAADAAGLVDQYVDFALPILYGSSGESRLKGYVIEVDGEAYHSSVIQKLNDHRRDIAQLRNWWTPKRIKISSDAPAAFEAINAEPYVQRIKKQYERSFDGDWLNILQLALMPSAVARVQIAILEAVHHGLISLEAASWDIVVVERDVPCAALAVKDLQAALDSIYALSSGATPPRINLKKVYCTAEFEHLATGDGHDRAVGSIPDVACDLVVDISMLRRTNLENLSDKWPCIMVRSDNWPVRTRVLQTTKPISYEQLAEYKDDQWQSLPGKEELVLYFLNNIFRKTGFRPGQIPILNRALSLKTVIGLLPTGGGKSLTYQLAAMLQPGYTVVVDPIRSLMLDQVRSLEGMEIDACIFVNSLLDRKEKQRALNRLENKEILFLFISPERLMIKDFRSVVQSITARDYFSYCVIDEVHCVSEWGHDFRTAYLALGSTAVNILSTDPSNPITLLGLTATASFDVLADVERELLLHEDQDAIVSAEYSNRDELIYVVQEVNIDYKTFDYTVTIDGLPSFTAKPIQNMDNNPSFSIKKLVAELKHTKLQELMESQYLQYCEYNDNRFLERELDASWNELLDEKYRATRVKDAWISAGKERIIGSWASEQAFLNTCATLIFAPHRSGRFGVTNKFAEKKANVGIADMITYAGFKGAIPPPPIINREDVDNMVGTFLGARDEPKDSKIDEDSIRNQELFIAGKLKVMVATKAFGMGIDKANIRFAVHFNPPSSPESFVQEAGRAGRDGNLALCYVLLNRQIFFQLTKKNLAFLRATGFKVPSKIDPIIGNKLFDEFEFENLLANLNLPNLYELKKINVPVNETGPFTMINPDREILDYFFNNSFKGVEPELHHLRTTLFKEITFPFSVLNLWGLVLSNKIGRDLRVSYRCNNTDNIQLDVYAAEATVCICSLIIPLLAITSESDEARYIGEALINTLIEYFNGAKPVPKEVKQAVENGIKLPGLVAFLHEKLNRQATDAISESVVYDFYIGFTNHITDDILKLNLYDYIINNIKPGCTAAQHTEIFDLNNTFSGYIEQLENRHILDHNAEKHEKAIRKIWTSARRKEDTDKLIYRLTCIGLVDDFEVDYLNKIIVLKIKVKSAGDYIRIVYAYLRRYYSDNRVRGMLRASISAVDLTHLGNEEMGQNIRLKQDSTLADLFEQLIVFIVDFAYKEIAEKRKAAISDMFSVFDEYLSNDGTENDNASFRMKSYLHLYFNSKYARENYEAKLVDSDAPAPFSLRDDTRNGEILEFTRVLEYMNVMTNDISGSETDNIKHLRGAAIRLLRSDPNNYSLHLIKAFTLFAIAWRNKSAFQEACASCEEGLTGYFGALDADNPEEVVRNYIEPYTHVVIRYLPLDGAESVKEYLRALPDIITLKYHLTWLKQFNSHFLTDFNPNIKPYVQ